MLSEYYTFTVFDQLANNTCISLFCCHVQQEALLVKQTAIHGRHMCKAPSASTTSPSLSKTATSAFSFYSPQHMSLLW